jgi:glycine/D-amino acid oxidase-like deaminating enzyme/nitrite reductase/ring-hydroxylating ferredoxin subunit
MKSHKSAAFLRDGQLESPWQHGATSDNSGSDVSDRILYDCLLIGGGITGLTAGLLLQRSGKKTILVEAHTIGFGTTGGTSAHINTFADTSYHETESAFGEKEAQLFARAVQDGFDIITQNINNYHIDCDFEYKPGYIYAENEDQVKSLDDLYSGTIKVGVDIEYTNEIPVPVPFRKAVQLNGQAQFHPIKYLQAIAREYVNAGGLIIENTMIEKIVHSDGFHEAQSEKLNIRAKKVIYATHTPPGINVFSFRCAPYRSYVVAVKLKNGKYPDALIYDMQEPYHYFRTHAINGEQLLLVGGNDHKTGHDDPGKAFEDLEKYIRQYFNVSSVKYKWSSQYYVPADGLPYVGQIPLMADGIYTATGYNGNGMMLGSISAGILNDLVSGKENVYAELFSTSRIKPIAGFTEFIKENADVAYHFVADRLSIPGADSLSLLKPGTGQVMEYEGKKIAAYRDEAGIMHLLNPVCTHAKCIVNWNAEEKSWDCPCHGARYDIEGKVLNGPAERGLQKLTINADK